MQSVHLDWTQTCPCRLPCWLFCLWRWLLLGEAFASDGIPGPTTPSNHGGECELGHGEGFQEEGWREGEAHLLGRHCWEIISSDERRLHVQAVPGFLEARTRCHSPGPDHWQEQGQESELAIDHGRAGTTSGTHPSLSFQWSWPGWTNDLGLHPHPGGELWQWQLM